MSETDLGAKSDLGMGSGLTGVVQSQSSKDCCGKTFC